MPLRKHLKTRPTISRRQILIGGLIAAGAYAATRALGSAGNPGSVGLFSDCSGTPSAKSGDSPAQGPLRAEQAQIVDQTGKVVYLTGVSWFGMETGTFCPHGLWARNWQQMLDQIVHCGFNSIRLPYSNQVFQAGSTPNGIDFTKNPDLQGLTGIETTRRSAHRGRCAGRHVIAGRQ